MNLTAAETSKIDELRAHSSPTDAQKLIVALADRDDRTPADHRNLRALIKAERAADRARSARAAAARVLSAEADAARKARTRRLIELGGLVEIAGFASFDRGAILGALASLANQGNDAETVAGWKRAGDAELAKRESAKK